MAGVLGLVSVFIALAVLDAWLWMGAVLRLGLGLGVLAVVPALLWRRRPKRWRQPQDWAACDAERRLGIEHNSLINAWQLGARASNEGSPLAMAQIGRALAVGREVAAQPLVSRPPPVPAIGRLAIWAGVVLLVGGGLMVGFPGMLQAGGFRLLMPWADHPPFSLTRFEVSVNPQPVELGSSAEVMVRVSGRLPEKVFWVPLPGDQESEQARPMRQVEENDEFAIWRYVVYRPAESVRFRVEAETGWTRSMLLKVVAPPPAELELAWSEGQADPLEMRPGSRQSIDILVRNRGGGHDETVALFADLRPLAQSGNERVWSTRQRMHVPDGRHVGSWQEVVRFTAPAEPGEYGLWAWVGPPFGPDEEDWPSVGGLVDSRAVIRLTVRVVAPERAGDLGSEPLSDQDLAERGREADVAARLLLWELAQLLQDARRVEAGLGDAIELDEAMMEMLAELLARGERIESLLERLGELLSDMDGSAEAGDLLAALLMMLASAEGASMSAQLSAALAAMLPAAGEAQGSESGEAGGQEGSGAGGQTGELGRLVEAMARAAADDLRSLEGAAEALRQALEAYDEQREAGMRQELEGGSGRLGDAEPGDDEAPGEAVGRAEGAVRSWLQGGGDGQTAADVYYRQLPEAYRQRVEGYMRSLMELDRRERSTNGGR